jgi:hypothetical protein
MTPKQTREFVKLIREQFRLQAYLKQFVYHTLSRQTFGM